MPALSIIILTKNEEKNIERTLLPLLGITDDILVIDNGSKDNTISIAKRIGAKVVQVEWQGYSKTKNIAHSFAKYDWILSLDADEQINSELKQSLLNLSIDSLSSNIAYTIKRKLVYAGTVLHHGAVGNEFRIRFFNRKTAHWNQNAVHEDIEFKSAAEVIKLDGFVWHHSYNSKQEHEKKVMHYAQLFAAQKRIKKTSFSMLKQYVSPPFGFIKNYFFRLGILDGIAGLQYAIVEMYYTFKKHQLANRNNQA